jgi:hypothetical protein
MTSPAKVTLLVGILTLDCYYYSMVSSLELSSKAGTDLVWQTYSANVCVKIIRKTNIKNGLH